MNTIKLDVYNSNLIQKIKNILTILIERHELLRSHFVIEDDELYCIINNYVDFEIECFTWEGEASLNKFIRPFSLDNPSLFRVALFQESEKDYYIVFDVHHIICDGASMQLILKEFLDLWQGFRLSENKESYYDYMLHLNQNVDDKQILQLKDFWHSYLPRKLPILDIPLDYTRKSVFDPNGGLIDKDISKESLDKVTEFCYKHKLTPFMFFLFVYYLLLRVYTGQTSFVIGTPVKGRYNKQGQNIFGPFINSVPILAEVIESKTLKQAIEMIRVSSLSAFKHQAYPFEELIKDRNYIRDLSRNAIFDTMIEYSADYIDKFKIDELTFIPYQLKHRNSKYDLSIFIQRFEEKAIIQFEYCTALFAKSSIESISESYISIIDHLLCSYDEEITLNHFIDNWITKNSLAKYHAEVKEYSEDIISLLKRAMESFRNETALLFKNKTSKFKDLDTESNKIANWLMMQGNYKNKVIAIYMDSSLEFIYVLLAIIKIGAVFLLIDKDTVSKRINEMLAQSETVGVFTDKDHCEFICTSWNINAIDYKKETENFNWVTRDGCSPLYIVFTSGTTGKPKGITISIKAMTNYINWAINTYLSYKRKYIMPFFTSVSFDLSFTSIFLPLVSGNCIALYDYMNSADSIIKIFKEPHTNLIKLTPTHINLVLSNLSKEELSNCAIETMIVGGENFKTNVARQIYDGLEQKVSIYNEYGPAEATIGCMIERYDINKSYTSSVSLGKPISNTSIVLINDEKGKVPIGAIGQICISGEGLADGYLSQPKLTSEKFIFIDGERYYLTGDYARYTFDNELIFLGRKDKQVKINGRRIELEEIASVIEQYVGIDFACVLTRNDNNLNSEIVAFYQGKNLVEVDILHKFIADYLPIYMIPDKFCFVDEFAYRSSGKLDEEALWKIFDDKQAVPNEVAITALPETEEEIILADIFVRILNIENVDRNSNFYYCGGDSIKAMQLKNEIEKNGYRLNLRDIFQMQTIEGIAGRMFKLITEVRDEGYSSISPIQDYFLKNHPHNYHVLRVAFEGLDVVTIEDAINSIVIEHDFFLCSVVKINAKNLIYFNSMQEPTNALKIIHLQETDLDKIDKTLCETFKSNETLCKVLITQDENKIIIHFYFNTAIIDLQSMVYLRCKLMDRVSAYLGKVALEEQSMVQYQSALKQVGEENKSIVLKKAVQAFNYAKENIVISLDDYETSFIFNDDRRHMLLVKLLRHSFNSNNFNFNIYLEKQNSFKGHVLGRASNIFKASSCELLKKDTELSVILPDSNGALVLLSNYVSINSDARRGNNIIMSDIRIANYDLTPLQLYEVLDERHWTLSVSYDERYIPIEVISTLRQICENALDDYKEIDNFKHLGVKINNLSDEDIEDIKEILS